MAEAKFDLKEPVARESLDRKAANRLREAITSGVLAAGTRLTENTLASDLGLSRGTIRAALHRLVSEGLVLQNMYSSWQVVPLSPHDAWELYTLRAGLEALAGRLTAERLTEASRECISKAFDALHSAANSGSPDSLADADLALHRTIVEASEHGRLIQHYRQVASQLRLYIRSVNQILPSPKHVASEHREMVESILARDSERAERILRDHSLYYGKKLVSLLELESDSERVQ